MPTPPRLARRSALAAVLRAAGALVAAPALTGCSLGAAVAGLQQSFKPVPLTVFLLGGAPGRNGQLHGLEQPLRAAVTAAAKQVARLGATTFQVGNSATSWFPLPTTLFNLGTDQSARSDDPSIPMPDVVVAPHAMFPNYLANRALDLTPTLRLKSSALQGISAAALATARAYGYGSGTFQAALPLLRIPLLCAVRPGVSAIRGTKAWTVAAFQQTLAALAPTYGRPNAVLPWIPFGMGVPEMAAIGSGGTLAVSGSTSAQATFADAPTAAGIEDTLLWAGYAARHPPFRQRSFDYAILMFDGQLVLENRGRPFRFGPHTIGPNPKGWTVAPVPTFPARPATPVRTIDVMVFKHSKAAAVAADLAVALLSATVQAELLQYAGALALRPAQALRQLTRVVGAVQGAGLIADPKDDITGLDAYGAMTDGNEQAQTLVRNDLLGAIDSLAGGAGQYGGYSALNGPAPGFGGGSFAHVPAPAGETPLQVLRAAQQAANAGKAYPG